MTSLSGQAQQTTTASAEETAKEYMTAFFHGDLRTAASLTHPSTLDAIKTSFLKELKVATNEAGEPVTPADYGLTYSLAELRELRAEVLYVAVLEADRKRDPAFAEAMRDAKVEVAGSRNSADGMTIVQLRILTPGGNGELVSQEAGLMLRTSGMQWRVVGNAP